MISIVICSQHTALPELLTNSIRQTIHTDYEIIHIHNSANQYSIFEAYNQGVEKSKFPYICFVHDDVVFHTPTWGETLIRHLSNPQTGIIGVAGCGLIVPISGRWNALFLGMSLIQSDRYKRKKTRRIYNSSSICPAPWPVVALDGVFLAMRKELFSTIRFDESITGFHGYDLDICIQSHVAGYRNYAVDDILIEHLSNGKFSLDFYQNTFAIYQKWEKYWPLKIHDLPQERAEVEIRRHLGKMIHQMLKIMLRMHLPHDEIKARYRFFTQKYGTPLQIRLVYLLPIMLKLIAVDSKFRKKMF